MNRWKGDTRKQVSPSPYVETSESVGAKADSANSSFGSTIAKKSKTDFKLRANVGPKTQFKAEKLPAPRQATSSNNEGDMTINVQQAMQQIRQTILEQDAVFREQVRELHRVHKVQTFLMAEMRKNDSDLLSLSSRKNISGPSQAAEFPSTNSGSRRNSSNPTVGQALDSGGKHYDASILWQPEPIKSGSIDTGTLPLEVKLFKQNDHVTPVRVRKTFDLERPPEDDDDDDDPVTKDDESIKPLQGICMKFIESPVSCNNEQENDVCLNLSTGWGSGKSVKDAQHFDNADVDTLKSNKRSRETEEATLFPFLASKSEALLRDAPLRPTPSVATRSLLGGTWGLQLGSKRRSFPEADGNTEDLEVPKKKERVSLELEVDDKTSTLSSQSTPHWLLQTSLVKSSKKAVGQMESSSLNLRDPFSCPPKGSEQGEKVFPRQERGEAGTSSAPGSVWAAEHQFLESPAKDRSQSCHNAQRMVEEDVQAGMGSVFKATVSAAGSTMSMSLGYGPFKQAQVAAEAPREAVALFSPWRDAEGTSNNFTHGVFTQSHPLAGGFGVQMRSFEGHPTLAAMNFGPGNTSFVPDATLGLWYQQRNSDSQYQHQQLQAGTLSSSHQGPWQTPIHIPQGTSYAQGAVFAIPTPTGPSVGFPVDGFRKVGDDHSGANWTTAGNIGPPFTPFSIVVPPKPPFKRPPKLVLTHDGTTMELKLVSPNKDGAGKMVAVEKSLSGSSDEEIVVERKEKGSVDGLIQHGVLQRERDVSTCPRGKKERDKRSGATSLVKEKWSSASGGAADWMTEKVPSSVAQSKVQGRNGVQPAVGTTGTVAYQEGMDDADGGSSDAGSGGSGVGDVINPGEGASPCLGTSVAGGCDRNLPAGEGEEGVNMGELGTQADSESQTKKFNKKSQDSKPRKHQEVLQEHFSTSLSFGSNMSIMPRKIIRENLGGSGHGVDHPPKRMRAVSGANKDGEERALVLHGVVEQSASSSGAGKDLPDKGSQSHKKEPSLDEFKDSELEHQQPSSSTTEPRVHSLKLLDSGSHSKETSNTDECPEHSLSDHGSAILRDQYGGRTSLDTDGKGIGMTAANQKNSGLLNFDEVGKQVRETKSGHSKQLLGAITSEKDVQHNPYNPGLHQVPSPSSKEDMERHAEGSSKKVSQASETVQGNGRSPLQTGQWIEPTSTEQDHFCSPGGISSCEEVSLQTLQVGYDSRDTGTHQRSTTGKTSLEFCGWEVRCELAVESTSVEMCLGRQRPSLSLLPLAIPIPNL